MAKILSAGAAIFLICVCFSGCFPHTELDEKIIVEAVSVDYLKETDEYEIGIQYYNMTGTGGRTHIDSTKPNVLTAKGKGTNIYEAVEQIQLYCGRELMLGSVQVVILGHDTLQHDISDIFSIAKTYHQSHPNQYICVAQGKAADYMKVKFVEGLLSSEKLKFLLENAKNQGIVRTPTILEVFLCLESRQKTLCLPMLKLEDDGTDASEDGKSITFAGGVLLKNEKWLADLDLEFTSSVMMLQGKVVSTSITIPYEEQHVTLGLTDVQCSMNPKVVDGQLVVDIKVSADGTFKDSLAEGGSVDKSEDISIVAEDFLKKKLEAGCRFVINQCLADVLHLELKLKHNNYSEWLKQEESFEDLLPNTVFNIETHINISRFSLEK